MDGNKNTSPLENIKFKKPRPGFDEKNIFLGGCMGCLIGSLAVLGMQKYARGADLMPYDFPNGAKEILLDEIDDYQNNTSPLIKELTGMERICLYEDLSCSNYGKAAIEKYGAKVGFFMAARRILSCHPWSNLKYQTP